MAGYSRRVKPPQSPHDNNDDLSSLYSRPSIQNSSHWPSVKLRSPGSSVRTLNQSDGGTYRDDISSLANFSSNGLDQSVRGSVSTANMSTSPSSSRRRRRAPSGSSRQKYEHLSLDRSEESGRGSDGGPTQSSPSIRADKRPYQAGLPPLVRKSTISSTVFQDDRGDSLLIGNLNEDLPNPASNPSRSRPSHRKSTSQSRTLTPPLLSPGASRDSTNSPNSNQSVRARADEMERNGHSRGRYPSRDPEDNVLPGGWASASTGFKESKAPGDHTNSNESRRHKHPTTPLSQPEEQEVKAYTPGLVSKVRPARRHKATLVAETSRADAHGAKTLDRHPVPAPTLGERDHNPAETGWVVVPPIMSGAPPYIPSPLPQHSSQSSRGGLTIITPDGHSIYDLDSTGSRGGPMIITPDGHSIYDPYYSTGSRGEPTIITLDGHEGRPPIYNPYSTGSRGELTVITPDGHEGRPPIYNPYPYSTGPRGEPTIITLDGHKKGRSTNYNPSSPSQAAKPIVVIDAAKRKATSGDAPRSRFRKFFSLSRSDSLGKSPGK